MKNFFETFKNSIWGKEHYATMAGRGYKETFKYFFSLILLVSFVVVVSTSIFLVPKGLKLLDTLAYMVVAKYPSDLVLNFSNGLASTSVERVYSVEITPDTFSPKEIDYLKAGGIENFLIIDTRDSFQNLKQFESAKTMILLTKDVLVVRKEKGSIEINPIPKNLNETITKDKITYLISKITPFIKYMVPIMIISAFAGIFLFCSFTYLFLALFSGLFLWLISSIMKRKGHYKEFFITSLYAITLTVVINLLLSFFGKMSFVLSLVITLVVWMVNVEIWKKAELPSKDVAEPPIVVPPTSS